MELKSRRGQLRGEKKSALWSPRAVCWAAESKEGQPELAGVLTHRHIGAKVGHGSHIEPSKHLSRPTTRRRLKGRKGSSSQIIPRFESQQQKHSSLDSHAYRRCNRLSLGIRIRSYRPFCFTSSHLASLLHDGGKKTFHQSQLCAYESSSREDKSPSTTQHMYRACRQGNHFMRQQKAAVETRSR